MYLYFHTNTEMALHYIKDLLSDDAEHPVSEIYDYVMENCKGQAIMGQPMTATVISSALWRLAHTEGSGYYRTRRGIYQKGDPEKEMKVKLTPYERAVRIVTRAEREVAGSFYMYLDGDLDTESTIRMQEVGRGVLEKLARIKGELSVSQQELMKENPKESVEEPGMTMGY
ncbi:MAG: hypothetical protein KH900_03450 [[Clostridium] symbiosum]|uniref:hypothetical protein n=1 Tax=Clostridium sp. chh4-2 TaxID=2067550 RepID=UPI000CCFC75F|nr:hypothetical protein [Clostridium sp. chh4-2]MBS6219485.1 hypothetical protein [[Clostridium] symbiosum]PNV63071.1 hypothetical protein C0033_05995 [Clostridium sp. chh4-2]